VNEEALAHWGGGGAVTPKTNKQNEQIVLRTDHRHISATHGANFGVLRTKYQHNYKYIGPTDLQPSSGQYLKPLKVFLIYFPICPNSEPHKALLQV
jgi:hypothetical protein